MIHCIALYISMTFSCFFHYPLIYVLMSGWLMLYISIICSYVSSFILWVNIWSQWYSWVITIRTNLSFYYLGFKKWIYNLKINLVPQIIFLIISGSDRCYWFFQIHFIPFIFSRFNRLSNKLHPELNDEIVVCPIPYKKWTYLLNSLLLYAKTGSICHISYLNF